MEVSKDWYRIIEDIIQCPVCLKLADSFYIYCERGHHMCGYCLKVLKTCPMCYNNFLPNPINHLVANDLTSRLSEIQLSINQDTSTKKSVEEKNVQTDETKLLIPAKKSVYTQTCTVYSDRLNNINSKMPVLKKTHSYPCLICYNYFKTYQQLENHLQLNHKEKLEKFDSSIVEIGRKFVVQCDKLPWECEYVFSTCSGTLYFVNILIHSNWCMKCYVLYLDKSYPSNELCTELYYSITMHACGLVYTGKVKSHTADSEIEDLYHICFQGEDIRPKTKSTMSSAFTFKLHNRE